MSVVSPYLIEFETGVIEMTRRPFAMLTEMTWAIDAPLLSVMVKVSVKLCGVVKRPIENTAWFELKDQEVPVTLDPETVALLLPVPLMKVKV